MIILVTLLLPGCRVCPAQTADECKPSTLKIPCAVYPDHPATFRVVAPDAQKVQVRVGQTFDMVKGIGRMVDGHHNAAGRGVSLLFDSGGWRHRSGPCDPHIFRPGLG
jgi:hypothetical protein